MTDSVATCRLLAVGDLMLCGTVSDQMRAAGDGLWGFRGVLDLLRGGDVLFGNFETPITVEGRPSPGSPSGFRAPREAARALADAGFHVVNLAHNHAWDFGAEGVRTTLAELAQAGLPPVGLGTSVQEARRPVIAATGDGFRVAFLAYTTAFNAIDTAHAYHAAPPVEAHLRADIEDVRARCDAVVVSCHTGAQFNPYPSPETRHTARVAIDAGACLFLGHHPHVLQGLEKIAHGLAAYSLGDFCAPPQNEQTRRTFLLEVDLHRHRVVDHRLRPCLICEQGRPAPAAPPIAESILADVRRLSDDIRSGASDRLHFDHAGSRFFSQYVRSWWREMREGGPGVLVRKFSRLRPYHWALVRSTLKRLWRRRAP